jgi:arsenate reductase
MVKILFVCIHNSARSQMAEAFVNSLAQGKIFAHSAGLTPGKLNPLAVSVMKEIGMDLSRNVTKNVHEFIDREEIFDYVVTVCDAVSAEHCPNFPGKAKRLHWGFEDPSSISGSDDEKLSKTRVIRDQIQLKVKQWMESVDS